MVFNFSSNSLNGSLPLDIGNLKVVVGIDLSRNNLSDSIPTVIGGRSNLAFFSLAYNKLQGSIPESLGDLRSLEFLDLSNNSFSGFIPRSFEKLLYLEYLNLSFNRLKGEIPSGESFANFSANSFMGNSFLCGSPNLQVPPRKDIKTSPHRKSRKNTRLLVILVPLTAALIMIIISAILVLMRFRCKRSIRQTGEANYNVSSQVTWRRFLYQELSQATEGFSETNLMGTGSFGPVYKARLVDGMEVAVKVFHLQLEGD